MTDADRLMFLKMIYEHGEVMYLFSEEHQVTNFEFYPVEVLSLLSRTPNVAYPPWIVLGYSRFLRTTRQHMMLPAHHGGVQRVSHV